MSTDSSVRSTRTEPFSGWAAMSLPRSTVSIVPPEAVYDPERISWSVRTKKKQGSESNSDEPDPYLYSTNIILNYE